MCISHIPVFFLFFFTVSRTGKHCQVHLNLGFTITYELSFNCGELLFEAGKILVKRPHKCLVGPEWRLIFRTLSGIVGRAQAWRAWLRAISSHLIYEPLQPRDRLPVHSNVLQYRVQAILQRKQRKDWWQSWKKAPWMTGKKKAFLDFWLTLVRWVTTTLFLTDTFPSCCWNIKCLLTPENSLNNRSHKNQLY